MSWFDYFGVMSIIIILAICMVGMIAVIYKFLGLRR